MAEDNTVRKLAEMTDAGAFEQLATAIVRQSDDRYRRLSHPGVNADGKTVKSPVDGIAFVPGASPPHMIAVHHTVCLAKDLDKKWLHDPSKVRPHKEGGKPTAPAGDILKTIEIVAEERKRTPDLRATLILTTNEEPGQALIRSVHAVGVAADMSIDVWARSRLADFLDNYPQGQWLRHRYFGTPQVQLSEELFGELSEISLSLNRLPDTPAAWVRRSLDAEIEGARGDRILFVVGDSGSGKSVACHKRLRVNLSQGGFSLILTNEIVASSLSLEQAIERALSELAPSLAPGCGGLALRLASSSRPLMLAVEDINRAGRGPELVERIAGWAGEDGNRGNSSAWQVLCPVWPQVLSTLKDDVRKLISDWAIVAAVFTESEGATAVERRYELAALPITTLVARSVSAGLGNDPLLIALHEPATAPRPLQTIEVFIENSFRKLSATKEDLLPSEYAKALSDLAKSMLLKRRMEPEWIELIGWTVAAERASALRQLVHQRDIIHLTGPSASERLAFRHDRVREWLLAQAAADLINEDAMPDEIAADPYYAEIFGLALTFPDAAPADVTKLAEINLLALFHSVRNFHPSGPANRPTIVAALKRRLEVDPLNKPEDRNLRWEALRALAVAENAYTLPLISLFKDSSWDAMRARYRNGDLMGGIVLCLHLEPGVSAVGHDVFLDHVKSRYGARLIEELARLLARPNLETSIRSGGLRLAGHLGEPALGSAILACWSNDPDRKQHLDDYLWACAQCAGDDPAHLLGPVCDAWTALPRTQGDTSKGSPRDELAAHNIRWAFRKRLPVSAVRYFIERAADPELEWPITYLLHGVDQPDAVEYVVRYIAEREERGNFWSFSMSSANEWNRRLGGTEMSEPSRRRLREIWQDGTLGKHLKKRALKFWASTCRPGDIEMLRLVPSNDEIADDALWHRLKMGDREAIPGMISKLTPEDRGYWWQQGRYVWSDELTRVLEEALSRRGKSSSGDGGDAYSDQILSEMVMRLPLKQAEALLKRNWDRLSASDNFVIAALYVATPDTRNLANETLRTAPDPKALLKYLASRFGFKQTGHPGIFRMEQIEAVVPYLDHLADFEILRLWEACNEHQWFALRQEHLDGRISSNHRKQAFLEDESFMAELDKYANEKGHWIDHLLDQVAKTGRSTDEIMSIIDQWLRVRHGIEALKLACDAVLHIGGRRHICIIREADVREGGFASVLVANTDFGVKRRTLAD